MNSMKRSTLRRVIRAKLVPIRRTTADFVVEYQSTVCAGDIFQELLAFGKVLRLNAPKISVSVFRTTRFGFMMDKLKAKVVEVIFLFLPTDVFHRHFCGDCRSLIRHRRPTQSSVSLAFVLIPRRCLNYPPTTTGVGGEPSPGSS